MSYSNDVLYGYLRVSTDGQADKGNSIEFQKELGQKIAERNGFKKFIPFNESSISGTTNPLQREQFSKIINLIKEGKCKHLYAYEWSRISREVLHSEILRKLLLSNDVKFWEGDTDKPKDLNNPIDKLTSTILSSLYQYERENMVKRIKAGIKESVKKGKWSGAMVPYGYKRGEDGYVVVDEDQAKTVRQMIKLVMKGKSVRAVTNWLNKEDIPTKAQLALDKDYIERERNGQKVKDKIDHMMWRDNTVMGILTNTYIKGERVYKGEVFDFPSIITEAEWEELQQKIEKNKRVNKSGGKQKYFYLLKGLLYCKRHDKPYPKLGGRIKSDQRSYYCSKKRINMRSKGEPPCSLPSPNLDMMNEFVWDSLLNILASSEIVKRKYESYMNSKYNLNEVSIEEVEKSITSTKAKIDRLEQKKQRLLDLYLDEQFDKQTLNTKKAELQDQINEQNAKLRSSKSYLQVLDSEVDTDYGRQFYDSIVEASAGDSISDEDKRRIVLYYIDKILVDHNGDKHTIDIRFRYPIVNDSFDGQMPEAGSDRLTAKISKDSIPTLNVEPHQTPCGVAIETAGQ